MNPSFYKIKVDFPKIGKRYIFIQDFLDYYRKQLYKESNVNKFLISHFLSKIEGIFFEISKSKRYGDNYSYSRVCKDYLLQEIINDPIKYLGNDKKIIVGTLSNMEKTYLDKVIKNDNVSTRVLKYLVRSNENFGDYNLILPGILPLKYSSIFYKFFNEIFVLNYNGKNREKVQEQINSFSIHNLDYNSKKFFTEFYNYFNLASDEFLEPFNEIKNENKNLIKNDEYYEILEDINSKVKSSEIELKESTNLKKVKLELHGVNNNKVLIKELSDDRKFLHFKDYTNLDASQENTPGKIPLDDYMILLEEYSSFRSMFKEVFFPNLEIDFELADYWRDKLYNYYEENDFTYEEFHNLYKNNGGTNGKQSVISWIKGKIMAPNDKNQLKILGRIMKDDFLIENYEDIFNECRKITDLNKNLGRKIGHLIRNIVRNNKDYMDLSCEEQFMYDKINNNIYKVVSKINC